MYRLYKSSGEDIELCLPVGASTYGKACSLHGIQDCIPNKWQQQQKNPIVCNIVERKYKAYYKEPFDQNNKPCF